MEQVVQNACLVSETFLCKKLVVKKPTPLKYRPFSLPRYTKGKTQKSSQEIFRGISWPDIFYS